MGTQTERGNGGSQIYVGPERDHFGAENANGLLRAVERGGGVVDEPGEAEALVWLGSDNRGVYTQIITCTPGPVRTDPLLHHGLSRARFLRIVRGVEGPVAGDAGFVFEALLQ